MSSAECVDVSSSRSGIRLRIEYFAEKPTAWRRFRRPNVSVGMVLWMETWHFPWRGRPDAKRFVSSAALVILSKAPSPPVWVCHVVPVPSPRTERLEYRTFSRRPPPAASFTRTLLMLRILNLKKAYGGHDVLKDVSIELGDRERVALVGANGAGKSTLLKIVAGVIQPDEGSLRTQGCAADETAYLPQDAGVRSGRSLWDEMLSSFPELQQAQAELSTIESDIGDAATDGDDERLQALIDRQGTLLERFEQLGGYAVEAEIAKVLHGLGFASVDRDKPTEAFSGGWQMRIALAKMLVRKPGLLLLDEPTNHLDLAACEWLEGYLAEYPGLILVVSHDRYFLDRVTQRTIELDAGVATDYRGNYSHYLAESARRRAEHKAAYERQQKYIARQVAFINATRANAARAALAKSRERTLEKLERVPAPKPTPPRITVKLASGKRAPERVLTAESVAKS